MYTSALRGGYRLVQNITLYKITQFSLFRITDEYCSYDEKKFSKQS